jgi:NADP-dependent 3-hydroxy acid dehydrogenase YdfG
MSESIEGKVALVTGASSGIGEATAQALSDAGAKVALVARRKDRIDALSDRIRSGGGTAVSIAADITEEATANDAVRRANEELGGLDFLVNNAGVMLLGPVAGADTGHWRRMIDVNLLGLLYCTHAALPIMGEAGGGHVVNVSSVAGRIASLGSAVYNMTKWGVVGFSEGLRQEVLHANVRVTVIEPGFVETELQGHNEHPLVVEEIEKMRDRIEPLQSGDVANAVLYAVGQPQHVSINEVLVRPTKQQR